jgi:predicted amidohydrolase
MKVGYYQFSPEFGRIEKNVEKALSAIKKLRADLVVLPELFNTGYLFTSKSEVAGLAEKVPGGFTTDALVNAAREESACIVAGVAEKGPQDFYNTAVLVSPGGYIGKYRKAHLFFEERKWFQPGNSKFQVFDLGVAKIGIMICWDWIFPEAMRSLALKGADIICHPSNLVLSYCTDAMVTRSLENGVYAVTASRTGTERRKGKEMSFTGLSQIIDPRGNVLARGSKNREEAKSVKIDPTIARDKSYTKYNDIFKDRRPDMYDC